MTVISAFLYPTLRIYENAIKVIKHLENISYYLMGNDLVINDLLEVSFVKEGNILTITGKQDL